MKNEELFLKLVKRAKDDPSVEERKKSAFEKYGDFFKLSNVANLDIEKFKRFFNFSENKHWRGLNQNISLLISRPKELKEALKVLLDDSKDISERIDRITGSSSENAIKGLGLARISAILQFAFPDKYGAYNEVSLGGLTEIGENPRETEPHWNSLTLGEKYKLVNQKLLELSRGYRISLWALDWAWYPLVNDSESEDSDSPPSAKQPKDEQEDGPSSERFGLEKHLEEFLVDNWDNTALSREFKLEILKDNETGESIGKQYRLQNSRRIDILCKNNKSGGYTVIELKRDDMTLNVFGQIKLYMGWVKKNLANGKPVDGIIIAHDSSEDLKYALADEDHIQLFTYQIEFKLNRERLDL